MNRLWFLLIGLLFILGSISSFLYGSLICVDCAVLYPCRGCSAAFGEYPYCSFFGIFAVVLFVSGLYNSYCAFKIPPECKVCGRELGKHHSMIINYPVCETCYRNIRNRLNRESRLCFTNLDVLYEKQKQNLKARGLAK